jgi:hypothetical protein
MTPTQNPSNHAEELQRLEFLREYKRILAGDGTTNRSPFADDRVVRIDSQVENWDIPEVHREVRLALLENLAELHQGKCSRVVILAGEPGIGKSHLLQYFRSPKLQEQHDYVFVGHTNNFWKVDEFEAYLLTLLVTALVRPNFQGPNLLLDKISDLAFQALEQILDRPGQIKTFLAHKALGWLGRVLGKLGPDQHTLFQKACQDRDLEIFRRLDFHRFADFVCDRFLCDKTNPFHRFVLYVLLRYLFPEDRFKVCAWLIGQQVHEEFFQGLGGPYKSRREEPRDPKWPSPEQRDAAFQKEFGISDRLNLNFKLVDTIRILLSLFSPELNKSGLRNDKNAAKIFFFAFDQVEGRNEIFEHDKDWFRFFAKLSELYNALPNVFIVFTMTLGLRNRLYPQMESQFRQRISRDQKFVLREIDDQEILAIYRKRLELWREGRFSEDLQELLSLPGYDLLPFRQEEILEMARKGSLRDKLETFDRQFRETMNRLVVGARIDFLVAVNEKEKGFKHLEAVQQLLERVPGIVLGPYGLTLILQEICHGEDNLQALKLELATAGSTTPWVRIFLVPLSVKYRSKLSACGRLLYAKEKNKNFLWAVRQGPKSIELDDDLMGREEQGQVFTKILGADFESRLGALLKLLDKQESLAADPTWSEEAKENYRQEVEDILVEEIKLMYLGEMFQQAAEALENLTDGVSDDAEQPGA